MMDPATERLPELKEIVGALLWVARQPLTPAHIRSVLQRTAERYGGVTRDYAQVSEPEIAAVLQQLIVEYQQRGWGVQIVEVAGGFRIENLPRTGPWVRTLLDRGRPNRLSQPALETLAIIAYRQPIVRAEIEAIRGVAVDQILRNLLELGLIRIVGRSDLPGRPWLFGTTQRFLEVFGLRSLEDLPGVEELRRFCPGNDGDRRSASSKPAERTSMPEGAAEWAGEAARAEGLPQAPERDAADSPVAEGPST